MKILIRLPNWLGDVIMSTAFIAAVKQFYPEAQVDVIIKQELSSAVSLIPGLNQIHPFSKSAFKGLTGVYRFGKQLWAENYHLYFCLPDSLSSAVMGWATGAKKRAGFSKEGRFFLMTNSFKKPANLHRVDEYISLLEQFTGQPVRQRSVGIRVDTPALKNQLVIINFNSEAISRRMPVNKAVSIITTLLSAFPGQKFAFVGSPKDAMYVDEVISHFKNNNCIENYTGKTDLKGLAVLMAGAKAVLTTDSGPAHLANATGVPTVVVFGAGNELNTAPYNKQQLTVMRAGQLPCEPCVQNTCKLYGIPRCMELLDEMRIINALSVFLKDA